jgi:hypothetical protein
MIISVTIIITANFGIARYSLCGRQKESILSIIIAIGRCIA